MVALLLGLLLAGICLAAAVLQNIYRQLPIKELKRRAQAGDELADLLHRAVTYGGSLDVLLWTISALSAAGFFIISVTSLRAWLALLLNAALVWLGFVWLPQSRVSNFGWRLASWLAPSIAWLLGRLHPVLKGLGGFLTERSHLNAHTGLYQREDLLELLEYQAAQADNRIAKEELSIAAQALTFGDKLIRDVMTPTSVVKKVSVKDAVGPVLLTELHDSGFSRFPVYKGSETNVVGTLFLHDLVGVKTGKVSDLMSKKVYYVNEDQPLGRVFNAFLKTNHHMFIVVNNFEEMVGVISIEDVLEQIIGKPIVDEFDQYDDMRAVAKLQAEEAHEQREGKVLE